MTAIIKPRPGPGLLESGTSPVLDHRLFVHILIVSCDYFAVLPSKSENLGQNESSKALPSPS